MYSQKLLTYQFFHKKVLASLLISKELCPQLKTLPSLINVTLTFNTLKLYDINLLTINALMFLLFGQYPKPIFDKKLAKYRKSKISFMLTFSKKVSLYMFFKIYLLSLSRQNEFTGYTFKTIFFIIPQQLFSFPVKNLMTFYLIDYLYGQQPKNILTVKQQFTLNINCSFAKNSYLNMDFLKLNNLPLFFDNDFTNQVPNPNTLETETEPVLTNVTK
jgi:hypothetical protein